MYCNGLKVLMLIFGIVLDCSNDGVSAGLATPQTSSRGFQRFQLVNDAVMKDEFIEPLLCVLDINRF